MKLPKIEFSKIIVAVTILLVYPSVILLSRRVLYLAEMAITLKFTGALPYLTAISWLVAELGLESRSGQRPSSGPQPFTVLSHLFPTGSDSKTLPEGTGIIMGQGTILLEIGCLQKCGGSTVAHRSPHCRSKCHRLPNKSPDS